MGHVWKFSRFRGLRLDGVDLDDGKFLAVSAAAVVALALLLFIDDDLLASAILEDGRGDFGAFYERGAELEPISFTESKYFADLELCPGFGFGIAIEDENVAFLHGVLLALCLDGCFHLK